MKPLEELLLQEQKAVEPTEIMLARGRAELLARVGLTAAASSAVMTSTKAASALGALKGALVWPLFTVATISVGVGAWAALSSPTDAPLPTDSSVVRLQEVPRPTAPIAPALTDIKDTATSDAPVSVPKTQTPVAAKKVLQPSRASGPLQADLALLRKINAALNNGDGQSALTLLASHRSNESALATEFLAVRAIALCQLGQFSGAAPIVKRLINSHAPSPALKRVENACHAGQLGQRQAL